MAPAGRAEGRIIRVLDAIKQRFTPGNLVQGRCAVSLVHDFVPNVPA